MSTPKVTREQRQERIMRQCLKAEVGQDGLKRVSSFDFFTLTNGQRREILTEPFVITSEDEDLMVVRTMEQDLACRPPRGIPGKTARMVKLDGVFYRECL